MYVKLKEDTQVDVWYRGGEWTEPRYYSQGTIFMGDGKTNADLFYVYLDDDGDGEFYIPTCLRHRRKLTGYFTLLDLWRSRYITF